MLVWVWMVDGGEGDEHANAGVELHAGHAEIIFEVVEAGLRDCVAIYVIEKVHNT